MRSTPHQGVSNTSSITSFSNNSILNSEVNNNISNEVNKEAISTTLKTAVFNDNNYKNSQLNSAGTSLISSVEEYDIYELNENNFIENNIKQNDASILLNILTNSFLVLSPTNCSVKKKQVS